MPSQILRDKRGMSLLEVMMAVAVLGIIILFITQMTNTSSRITADNSDRVRMMELARAEAERIRADISSAPDNARAYAIKFEREGTCLDGDIYKVTVSPDSSEQDGYVLVLWKPPIPDGDK